MLTKRKLLVAACLLVMLSPFALAWLAAGELRAGQPADYEAHLLRFFDRHLRRQG